MYLSFNLYLKVKNPIRMEFIILKIGEKIRGFFLRRVSEGKKIFFLVDFLKYFCCFDIYMYTFFI